MCLLPRATLHSDSEQLLHMSVSIKFCFYSTDWHATRHKKGPGTDVELYQS